MEGFMLASSNAGSVAVGVCANSERGIKPTVRINPCMMFLIILNHYASLTIDVSRADPQFREGLGILGNRFGADDALINA